jgi:hypothetical protein
MKGPDDRLTFSADGIIDQFFIGTVDNGIILNDTRVTLSAVNLSPTRTLETFSGKLNARLGSGLFDSRRLDASSVSIDYHQLRGTFTFTGVVDSLYHVSFGGQSSIQPNTYVFDLDSLNIGDGDYRWTNDQDIQTRLNYEGFRVMHAVMKRGSESLSFTGATKHSGEIDFTGTLHGFDLDGLNVWLRNPERARAGQGFRGVLDADVKLSGSQEAPLINFNARSEDTYFKQTRLGSVSAKVNYADKSAAVNINVKESPSNPADILSVRGNLPIDLAFRNAGRRFPDVQQELFIISEGSDLSILDPLIADLDNLSGKVRCNVIVGGTPNNPEFSGSISLADVQCTFGPNNIPYTISGELEPSGDKIILKDIQVKNPLSERMRGDARFTGSISIKDYRIASVDITAFGQLLLMTSATRKTIPTFYGTLLTEIEPPGLNLKGTLDQPFLSGHLSILNADLEYPPTMRSEGSGRQLLHYIVVDDTSREAPKADMFSQKFYRTVDSGYATTRHVDRGTELSFVDRLRYNLDIETKGTTSIKMIFTPATNEELYAELEGKVSAINDRGTATIYGDISVLPRSYYNFFKQFDASGKLQFVGPWDNPVLDIEATYEGYTQQVPRRISEQGIVDEEQKTVEQKVIVELKIKGTRYEPRLTMGMKVQVDPDPDPKDWGEKGHDVQSDAISFILTGKFRDQLSSRERENIATSFGSAGVSGLTSHLLSGIFTNFLRQEFPFIRSAEFSYQGGSLQESANLRISSEVFNGYLRFGGKILNDINNANVSYQLSLGRMLNVQSIRNLFIELERKVEGSDLSEDKKLTNNARLYYRISF